MQRAALMISLFAVVMMSAMMYSKSCPGLMANSDIRGSDFFFFLALCKYGQSMGDSLSSICSYFRGARSFYHEVDCETAPRYLKLCDISPIPLIELPSLRA